MRKYFVTLLTLVSAAISVPSFAQNAATEQKAPESNQFTVIKELPITSIKDQANSGTCWSYSALSFIEAELIRMGKPECDLSEMFVVSHSYRDKGEKYVRLHGKLNFGQGGSFYDVMYVLKQYGIVPEAEMVGLNYGTKENAHNELASVTQAILDAVIKNPNQKLSTAWQRAYNAAVDSYLGELPSEFTVDGKSYDAKSYAKWLGLNMDDYVSLTSYTHHPFYTKFALEIEDNWRWSESYNMPIEELMKVMHNAIDNGFSIAWGADVSEIGFNRDGIGVLADVEAIENAGSDQERWIGASSKNKHRQILKIINTPSCPEINPTQDYRQECFDNYTLTDDHGMIIYGKAKNQVGKPFFMVKNSWGEAGAYKGTWYVTDNFVAGRTMNIIVHKDAIPADIKKKLGIH